MATWLSFNGTLYNLNFACKITVKEKDILVEFLAHGVIFNNLVKIEKKKHPKQYAALRKYCNKLDVIRDE